MRGTDKWEVFLRVFFSARAQAWITWELGMMLFAVESYSSFNVMSVDLYEISKIWIVMEANRV